MKFYIVVYHDYKQEGSIVTKGYYESTIEAESNLTNLALEFVRLDGGERQERVAFQNEKTLDQIKLDPILTNGLYLQEGNNKKMIYVYEKSVRTTGWFSSVVNDISKVGAFSITEIDFVVPERFSCGCNKRMTTLKKPNVNSPNITFIGELMSLINDTPNDAIKPIKKNHKNSGKNQKSSLDFLTDDINKIHQSV